jgi:hypothetical protein
MQKVPVRDVFLTVHFVFVLERGHHNEHAHERAIHEFVRGSRKFDASDPAPGAYV